MAIDVPNNSPGGSPAITDVLNDIRTLQVGFGSKVLRIDEQGIWLGAERFEDAPFSVTMTGDITATTLSLSNYLTKTGTGQNLTGNINVGNSSVLIDGVNNRIVINDGVTNRGVFGNV